MLPLVPLALAIAPSIGQWLFGSTAAKALEQVGNVVSEVTGVADPHSEAGAAQVEAVLQAKPELATALSVQLAQIAANLEQAQREADKADMIARFADTADARKQTISLAAAGSPIAWATVIVSTIVMLGFGGIAWAVLSRAVPEGSMNLATGLLEAFKLLAVTVVSYWCGSSAGSARKDQTIHQMAVAPPAP